MFSKLTSIFLLLAFLCTAPLSVFANAQSDIEFILAASKPPKGIVFEVVEGSENKLETALNEINHYIKALKSKYADIKIAVVSHGTEQFALLKNNKQKHASTHKKVQSLVSNDVPVSVCGTHASWYQLTAKDFPAYVDVADSGPGKIREYQRMGYALIEIDVK
ncbi:MAG: DsrE family protein [Gammaproteobacteria bacterium]|nr:DsrE family protein [Gammaproteobacteria bacterium]